MSVKGKSRATTREHLPQAAVVDDVKWMMSGGGGGGWMTSGGGAEVLEGILTCVQVPPLPLHGPTPSSLTAPPAQVHIVHTCSSAQLFHSCPGMGPSTLTAPPVHTAFTPAAAASTRCPAALPWVLKRGPIEPAVLKAVWPPRGCRMQRDWRGPQPG